MNWILLMFCIIWLSCDVDSHPGTLAGGVWDRLGKAKTYMLYTRKILLKDRLLIHVGEMRLRILITVYWAFFPLFILPTKAYSNPIHPKCDAFFMYQN